ncbi:MAG: hypothetical protein HGA85_03775 [Nanoarchaeota archaeon]|nr:hypothetical protein [Nanoarchaeota archaeon]
MDRKKAYKYMRYVGIAALILAIFGGKALFVLLIAMSLGLSFVIQNFPIRQLGLELVTFIAVLTGMRYGALAAVIVTFVLISYHLVMGGFISTYVLWVIPSYCLAGLIAGIFPNADIQAMGTYLTIMINSINSFFTLITSPSQIAKYLPYAVTNILFNIFLFTFFARLALAGLRI